jgi:hypothetical protein
MKYYIIDAGEKMSSFTRLIMDVLDTEGHHYLMFLTNEEFYLAVEEVNEDTFLDTEAEMKSQLN